MAQPLLLSKLCKEGTGVWPFLPRRRRERTLAGGTRAFFSAYHRNNEAHENRTLNRVRGFLAPRWGADFYWNHHPGVTLAALANPRLISHTPPACEEWPNFSPLLEKEGWPRHSDNGPVPYWRGRGGHQLLIDAAATPPFQGQQHTW